MSERPPFEFQGKDPEAIPDDELAKMVAENQRLFEAKMAAVRKETPSPAEEFKFVPPENAKIFAEPAAPQPGLPPVPPRGAPIMPIPKTEGVGKVDKSMDAEDIVAMLKKKQVFERIKLPSRFLGYADLGVPVDGTIGVKQMTVTEEKILSTARLLRNGQALDKIFENCTLENIDPNKLFSPDRNYLLFFIRGISYGSLYDFKAKCPGCEASFDEEIDLDELPVVAAEDGFDDTIHLVLPDSGLNVWHRVATGADEKKIQKHREFMIKGFGNEFTDDTIVFRNVLLTKRVEHFEDQHSIERIVANLSIRDSNALRDSINNPPFGVGTKITMTCPFCFNGWEMELPIDANFFFPSNKKRAS